MDKELAKRLATLQAHAETIKASDPSGYELAMLLISMVGQVMSLLERIALATEELKNRTPGAS